MRDPQRIRPFLNNLAALWEWELKYGYGNNHQFHRRLVSSRTARRADSAVLNTVMNPYRKRLKAGWNVGKGAKGDGEERQYAKREIEQELAAAEESYLERHHKGKRTRNMRAHLEYRVKWYEAYLSTHPRIAKLNSWLYKSLQDAKEELAAFLAKES